MLNLYWFVIFLFRSYSIEDNLVIWMNRITHQSDEVKLKALKYFKKFLASNRSEVNNLILADANVHPLIVEVRKSTKKF